MGQYGSWLVGNDGWLSMGNGQWLAGHNGVEAIDWVAGIVDGATVAISIVQRVLSLDHIAIAGLVLVLRVTGQCVLHFVGEVVLWVRVVLLNTVVGDDRSGHLLDELWLLHQHLLLVHQLLWQ